MSKESDYPENAVPERLTTAGVQAELQSQPHLFLRLAENALTVSDSLRGNYLQHTANFVKDLRLNITAAHDGRRKNPILQVQDVGDPSWAQAQGEIVSFIDGGVGQVQISGRVPILLRVGSYCVRVGERQLSEREQFGYFPVILGDLQGGSKERPDFVDIVRITAELLGGLSSLCRTPNLRVLMFHGPLVYTVGHYTAGNGGKAHTPFTEYDIDLFLRHYAPDVKEADALKNDFLQEARLHIYPRLSDRSDEWVDRRLFEPLSWMAFLLRRLIAEAQKRQPVPLIIGVVERGGALREFSRRILMERVFERLRAKGKANYFNETFQTQGLNNPDSVIDRLNYTDALLLAMLLEPGQYSEPWNIDKYSGLNNAELSLPGEGFSTKVRFSHLRSGPYGFPTVRACYVCVSPTTDPVRVEVFPTLGDDQISEAAWRVYLYSRLLPGYGFPVGLDIADKHAHVPTWMTEAYGKLIRYHLSVALQKGEISDAEMRRVLVQALYLKHRDWLFRPPA